MSERLWGSLCLARSNENGNGGKMDGFDFDSLCYENGFGFGFR